jgi:hypothetical protein
MREPPKSSWLNVKKRQWTTPKIEPKAVSGEVLTAFRQKYGASPALDRLAAKASSTDRR